MILLGNVPLILPTTEALAAAEALLPGAGADLWIAPTPAALLDSGAIGATLRLPRPRRLNELHWPVWGLSRWAVGHFLAHAGQAEACRIVAFGADGSAFNPLVLRLWAEDPQRNPGGTIPGPSGGVDHKVYLLPPVCLGRADPVGAATTDGLYLLTVVDLRWRLQYRSVPATLTIDADTSWGDLYEALGSVVGEGLFSFDEVHKDYAKPHPSLLDGRHTSLPMLLDAVAASVGQRIIAYRNGTFTAEAPTASKAIRDGVDGSLDRQRIAGGTLFEGVL